MTMLDLDTHTYTHTHLTPITTDIAVLERTIKTLHMS
jgi:hypothetical protein